MTEEKLEIIDDIKDLLEDHPERQEMLITLEELLTESELRRRLSLKAARAVKESNELIAAVKEEMEKLVSRNDTLYKRNKELLEENKRLGSEK